MAQQLYSSTQVSASATPRFTVWIDIVNGNSHGRFYDPSTNATGPKRTILNGNTGADEGINSAAVTTLSNGNYAVVWGDNNAMDDIVQLQLITGRGSNTTGATTSNFTSITTLVGSGEHDLLTGLGAVQGGGGNDTIFGGDGDDCTSGGIGPDDLSGGHDSDTFVCSVGAGIDNIDGGDGDGDGEGDTLSGIENIAGSFFLDRLFGDASGNVCPATAAMTFCVMRLGRMP